MMAAMRNLKITVAYVGTRYAGWQVQPGRPTIQGLLEDRLALLVGEPIRIAGAGRTDAGVHARGQVASFTTASPIPLDGLRRGLNARLPADIRVVRAEEAATGFHARTDARAKEYRYRMARGEFVSPFDAPYVTEVRGAIDPGAMREAAAAFLGSHDFGSFCPADCRLENKRRAIDRSEVREDGPFLEYLVRGNGFLRHMVRTMVGTLIDVGQGRRPPGAIGRILAARDRRAAGPCAPARGLVLEQVFYGEAP
jgi:tRNA pseudouridine38-40 synthase